MQILNEIYQCFCLEAERIERNEKSDCEVSQKIWKYCNVQKTTMALFIFTDLYSRCYLC